jgi:hypothetical protein
LFYQGLRERVKEDCGNRATLSMEAVRGENLQGVHLYWDPEGYAKEASGNRCLSL